MPEFGPVDTIRAAAAGGFDAVGLWIEPADWTAPLFREVRAALADTGLPLLDVEVIWLKPDSAMDDHRRTIDIGAELGAANVLCVSSDPDPGATATRLADLCRHAEGSRMRVALEFGIFTEVKDLPAALAILDRVGHPQRALLLDPIHVDRSGTPFEALAAVDRALLPYAQICDAPAHRPDPADFDAVIVDAIDLREQCGDGALPLDIFHRALPAGIPLSVELRSKALRDSYPDADARARVVAEATRRWLKAAG
ncbi:MULTISPECIES: sugar phosphate isomerase/epimerase family protein [unclassified Sphingomonas]|uniref:sugar phosphate isomerase/epimerase family protein n=1 Tax=unclassified Sphingomonas TaxID=196159 RepID=UPI001F4786A3|nr:MULTISPECIES: TIM barrel protein [unclassified Sphingomonas]